MISCKLGGFVTASVRARFNIKHVICVFKINVLIYKISFWQLIAIIDIGVFKAERVLPKYASGHFLYAQIRTLRWLI